jgi:hypothetical protein
MVVEQGRSPPKSHDTVANELVDGAMLLVDSPRDDLEQRRDPCQQIARRNTLCDRREALDVREEDREESAVAAEIQLLLRLQELAH